MSQKCCIFVAKLRQVIQTAHTIQNTNLFVNFINSMKHNILIAAMAMIAFTACTSQKVQVPHDPDGQWIYKFNYPEAADADGVKRFNTERLVNMKHHDYNLEPNVHLSPDGKWCIFRANFEGVDNVYAVEL